MADDIRLYLFECGTIRIPRYVVNAGDALNEERIDNPTPWYLLTHPRGNVVIDGGNAPEVADDPVKHWGVLAERSPVLMRPDQALLPELERIGVTPESIRWVVQSHLHIDHTGALAVIDRLPNAEVLVTRTEYDTAHNLQSWERAAYCPADYDKPGVPWSLLEDSEDGYDLFGDGTLRCWRTPGHTAGHLSFEVTLPSGDVFILAVDAGEHDGPPQREADPGVRAVDRRRHAVGAAAPPARLALSGAGRPGSRSRRVAGVQARTGVLRMTELSDLVDLDDEYLELGRGYEFTEGPTWSIYEQALIFSDIPGDTRYRWTGEGTPEVYVAPNHKGNGLVVERGGTYLVCESDTSVVIRFTPDGERTVVASHFEGAELNSPNDIVTRSDDSIYFTDPNYGRWNDWIGIERKPELDFQGVFRCERDGSDLRSSSRATSSSNRTASASRPTSRCCTSTTRRAATSRCSLWPLTAASARAGCSSRGSGPAQSARARPTG